MKFISLIILFSILAITKISFKGDIDVPQSIHADIQNDIKRLIVDYVEENLPTASNIKFHKVWTQKINKNKIKALFKYSFDDSNQETRNTRVAIDGFAHLNKEAGQSTADNEIWSFEDLQITNNTIEYKDGIKIKAGE